MPTTLRVLILEANPADAELAVAELRRGGFEPEWRRVDTETEYAARLSPELDVVLADYNLPGFDMLRALEIARDRAPGVPFVIVSGAISAEAAVECLRLGASDYVLRDRLERLPRAVAAALEQRRLRAETESAQEALAESQQRYRHLFEMAPVAYFAVGADGLIVSANNRAAELSGRDLDELTGLPALSLYADTTEGKEKALRVFRRFIAGQDIRDEELQLQRPDGAVLWVSLSVAPVRDADGRVVESRSGMVDITTRKRAEEELERLAITDPLTGLYTRRQFETLLEQAVLLASRNRTSGAVAYLDLDSLKTVNDTYGHETGDDLLRSVAGALSGAVRGSDVVARVGGDEFTVILHDVEPGDALRKATDLCRAVAAVRVDAGGESIGASCSVGLASFPVTGATLHDLIAFADEAMYEAKQSGGDGVSSYDPSRR